MYMMLKVLPQLENGERDYTFFLPEVVKVEVDKKTTLHDLTKQLAERSQQFWVDQGFPEHRVEEVKRKFWTSDFRKGQIAYRFPGEIKRAKGNKSKLVMELLSLVQGADTIVLYRTEENSTAKALREARCKLGRDDQLLLDALNKMQDRNLGGEFTTSPVISTLTYQADDDSEQVADTYPEFTDQLQFLACLLKLVKQTQNLEQFRSQALEFGEDSIDIVNIELKGPEKIESPPKRFMCNDRTYSLYQRFNSFSKGSDRSPVDLRD